MSSVTPSHLATSLWYKPRSIRLALTASPSFDSVRIFRILRFFGRYIEMARRQRRGGDSLLFVTAGKNFARRGSREQRLSVQMASPDSPLIVNGLSFGPLQPTPHSRQAVASNLHFRQRDDSNLISGQI